MPAKPAPITAISTSRLVFNGCLYSLYYSVQFSGAIIVQSSPDIDTPIQTVVGRHADEVPGRSACGDERSAAREEIYAKLLRIGFLEWLIHQSAVVSGFAVRITTVLLEILAVRTHPEMTLTLLLLHLA